MDLAASQAPGQKAEQAFPCELPWGWSDFEGQMQVGEMGQNGRQDGIPDLWIDCWDRKRSATIWQCLLPDEDTPSIHQSGGWIKRNKKRRFPCSMLGLVMHVTSARYAGYTISFSWFGRISVSSSKGCI